MQTQQANKLFHCIKKLVVKANVVAVVGLLAVGAALNVESHHAFAATNCTPSKKLAPIARHGAERTYIRRFLSPHCSVIKKEPEKKRKPVDKRRPVVKRKPVAKRKPITRHQPARWHRPAVGYRNLFPYGQCTWWANQRYWQKHGVFVPWTINSHAYQWTARARDFGWRISRRPSVGSIIDLQPWVQGAYGLGHVGFVERILRDGRVVVSTMNWGRRHRWEVRIWTFSPGPGVTFISLW